MEAFTSLTPNEQTQLYPSFSIQRFLCERSWSKIYWYSAIMSQLLSEENTTTNMASPADEHSDTTTNDHDDGDEIQQLQRECTAMVRLLKRLRRQEVDLRQRTEILAREALLCGFNLHVLEQPAAKKRRRIVKKEASG